MSSFIQYALIGLGTGAIYALLAQGLVVIYSGAGVLNLAHGAMAMLGGFLFWQFRVADEWSLLPALAASVGLTALLGALTHQVIMRPLSQASALARVVATLGLLVTLEGVAALIWGTATVHFVPFELPHHLYDVRGVTVQEDRLYLIGIAIALTAVLSAAYRFTSIGLAIRAGAANPRALAALGWSANMLATLTWSVGAALAAIAGILIAPIVTLGISTMPLYVIPALAAALLGSVTSLWLTLAGALAVGLIEAELVHYVHAQGVQWSIPFGIIVLLLIVRGKTLPVRGFFSERLPAVGTGQIRWKVLIPVVVVTGYLLMDVFPVTLVSALIVSLGWSILMLSVVVLLGFTSQLSFEQMAMAGLATLIAARLQQATGIPFLLAALIGLVAAVPIGAIFALPALRTRGVNLAVVTLGLGAVVSNMVLTNVYFTGSDQGVIVPPPHLFGIDIGAVSHPNRYALFVFLVFVGCALIVANIRRGQSGSALIAVRTNERAAAALGINVVQTKFFAFLIGSGLAATGGILLAYRSAYLILDEFSPFQSILVVSYAVIGGVGFLFGPIAAMGFVAGGLGGWILNEFYPDAQRGSYWLTVIGGVSVLALIILHPDGAAHVQIHGVKKLGGLLRRVFRRPARPPVREPLPEAPAHKSVPATLDISGLIVRFGGVTAVDDVSLRVSPGEIVGLIGPNGAGKTTVIDAVTGFVRPAAGVIRLNDGVINDWPVYRRAQAKVSRSFQSLELFETSTVRENLRVASDVRGLGAYAKDVVRPAHRPLSAAAAAAIREFELAEELDVVVSELPYGRRRLVAIARAIAIDPSVLLLDEPAAGLSAAESSELAHIVRRLAREWGLAVLVVEHDMSFVMEICDRIVVLDFGRRIAEGTPDQVRADPKVIASYLGEPEPAPVA